MNEIEKEQLLEQVKNYVYSDNIEGLIDLYNASQETKDKAVQITQKLIEVPFLSTCEIFNMVAHYMFTCSLAVKEGHEIDRSLWLEHTPQGKQPLSFHSDSGVSSLVSEVQG